MKRILTRKQTMILDLILKGKRNRQIAKAMDITEKGVKYHKTNLFKLYSVGNTAALIEKHIHILGRA